MRPESVRDSAYAGAVSKKQGQIYGDGAFQLYGRKRAERLGGLLADLLDRDDVTCFGHDWSGVVYFAVAEDESDTVFAFDVPSGEVGDICSLDEFNDDLTSGGIVDFVGGDGFDQWRAATGITELAMGTFVPTVDYVFAGGDPAQRATEPTDLYDYLLVAAAELAARAEAEDETE